MTKMVYIFKKSFKLSVLLNISLSKQISQKNMTNVWLGDLIFLSGEMYFNE